MQMNNSQAAACESVPQAWSGVTRPHTAAVGWCTGDWHLSCSRRGGGPLLREGVAQAVHGIQQTIEQWLLHG
jgi:hypothetical protein